MKDETTYKFNDFLSHTAQADDSLPKSRGGKRQHNKNATTPSLIGGIDAGDDRWMTSTQKAASGAPCHISDRAPSTKKRSTAQSGEIGVESMFLTPMARLKRELASRGARGIIGLSRKFKIMDDDGSNSLSYPELKKAIQECQLDFTEQEVKELFAQFDSDKSGTIDYEEFLRKIRGELNERRKGLVRMAYNVIDKDGNGRVDMADIVSVYDASKHPDVISGKRKSGEVLREFLDTFDVGGEVDGVVTPEEFENYYANVSASIDNDDYFELMIRNAWHISGGGGWCANSSNQRVLVTHADGSQTVEEIKDDLGLKQGDRQGMIDRLRKQGVSASAVESASGGDNGIGKGGKLDAPTSKRVPKLTTTSSAYGQSNPNLSRGNEATLGRPGSAAFNKLSQKVSSSMSAPRTRAPPSVAGNGIPSGGHPVLDELRDTLASRGARGIAGLGKAFRRMDRDGSKALSFEEFSEAISEIGISLPTPKKRQLFAYFDRDRSGSLSYDEFLVGIRGTLNKRRKGLVRLAFQKIDKDGNGSLDMQDVIALYDASKHPDVISGKRKSGEVLREFLDTFDVGGEVDGVVTPEEFENYYANLSASIDDDDYFELMIRNAWHISGGEGWCANSSNQRVLVTHADGSQTVEEIKDDLGLKQGDRQGMIDRLRKQGVSASAVESASGGDNGIGKGGKLDAPTSKSPFVNKLRNQSVEAATNPAARRAQLLQKKTTTFAPNLSSTVPQPQSSRPSAKLSLQTDPETESIEEEFAPSTSPAKGCYAGMTLPGGIVISSIGNKQPRPTNQFVSGKKHQTSMYAKPTNTTVIAATPDSSARPRASDNINNMKIRAMRLYGSGHYEEAENIYQQCLHLLCNDENVAENDVDKMRDNINKCREKRGLPTLEDEEAEAENEEW